MPQRYDLAGRFSRMGFCRGVSLVELMVSMVLGLLLMLGIVRVYLDSKVN